MVDNLRNRDVSTAEPQQPPTGSNRPNESPDTEQGQKLDLDEELLQAEQELEVLKQRKRLKEARTEIIALRLRGDARPQASGQLHTPTDTESNASTTGSKRAADEEIRRTIKRTLHPKDLELYYGKSFREHTDWVQRAETTFRSTPE